MAKKINKTNKTKKTSKAIETLVVQSKVKELIKKHKLNCASDVAGGLSHLVAEAIAKGCERAQSNGRKTLRSADL